MNRIVIVVAAVALSSTVLTGCDSLEGFFSAAPAGQASSQPSSMHVDQACPTWTTLQACTFGDTAYSVARGKITSKISANLDIVARRARTGLLGREPKNETVTLNGVLMPAWAKCGDELFVLASGPKGNANFVACQSEPAVGTPPMAACPAWTSSLLTKHERGFSAVGMSEGIEDPAFAVRAAENRARAKLVEAVSVQFSFSGGGASVMSGGSTSDSQTLASTTCGGITFSQVVGAAVADVGQVQAASAPAIPASEPALEKTRVTSLADKATLKKYHAYVVATHAAEAKSHKAMEAISAQCGTNLPLCLQLQKKNKEVKTFRAKSAATKKKLKLSDQDASDLRALWKRYLADTTAFSDRYGDSVAALFATLAPLHRKIVENH